MRITEHFTIEEFAFTAHKGLAEKNLIGAHGHLTNILAVCQELEKVRAFFNLPIVISSGFRCEELNMEVGGSRSSQHTKGAAVDFSVASYSDPSGLRFVFDWCCNHLTYGQLIFETPAGRTPWIHFGLPRPGRPQSRLVWDGKEYKNA